MNRDELLHNGRQALTGTDAILTFVERAQRAANGDPLLTEALRIVEDDVRAARRRLKNVLLQVPREGVAR